MADLKELVTDDVESAKMHLMHACVNSRVQQA